MRKKGKIIFTLILAVTLLLGSLAPTGMVYAASKTTNTSSKAAKKAFKNFLSKSSTATSWDSYSSLSDLSFICFDMGKGSKKIPMMLVKNQKASHAAGYVALFQYCKGKVRKVTTLDWAEAVYPKAGIIKMCYSGGGYGEIHTYYYKVKSKNSLAKQAAYTAILRKSDFPDKKAYEQVRKMYSGDVYKINNKTSNKSKFTKWWKKQSKGSDKITNIDKKLKQNTLANRNSYFK